MVELFKSRKSVICREDFVTKSSTTAAKTLDPHFTAKIVNLIAESMAIEEAELTPNASFIEDLHLDEIDIAELFARAEEELGAREFDDGDWEECHTVGEFVQLVASHLEKKGKSKH
jgi:acyl carrier protein